MDAERAARSADFQDWGSHVDEQTRNTFDHLLARGVFEKYFRDGDLIDVRRKSLPYGAAPISPQASGVELDYPGRGAPPLPFGDASQDGVFARRWLEHTADYRGGLRELFRVLRIGGHLILVVPHQFLYERKAQAPSSWNKGHERFYTAASLLREIEEALAPSSFRIRMLEENDRDFDYTLARDQDVRGKGGCEIVCVLEKIARPQWADSLFEGERVQPDNAFRRQPQGTGSAEPVNVIRSGSTTVKSVLALKLDHRGDFTMATDALVALRRNFPDARIVLVCGPWNAPDARALGLFDEVVAFALFPENASHRRQPFKTLLEAERAFIDALGGSTFDLAIDLRWDPDSRFLLGAAPARLRAGFGTRETFDFMDIPLALRQETAEGRADQYVLGADRFFSAALQHRGYAIVCPEGCAAESGYLIYGPYSAMTAGRYWLDLMIEPLAEPFCIGFDVAHAKGCDVLTAGELQVGPGGRVRLPLSLPEPVEDLEIRIRAGTEPLPPFRFLGCIVRREGSAQGVHQIEAMLSLVEVTAARVNRLYDESLHVPPP